MEILPGTKFAPETVQATAIQCLRIPSQAGCFGIALQCTVSINGAVFVKGLNAAQVWNPSSRFWLSAV
jgi:hypothetical protein